MLGITLLYLQYYTLSKSVFLSNEYIVNFQQYLKFVNYYPIK